jgi:hypothetical protein
VGMRGLVPQLLLKSSIIFCKASFPHFGHLSFEVSSSGQKNSSNE